MGRHRVVAVIVVLCAVALSGCGRTEQIRADGGAPVELEALDTGGQDRSPYVISYGRATGDGDDLVVIDGWGDSCGNSRTTAAALRRSDGSWWQLPPVPFRGYVQLASADGRAVAGGIACTEDTGPDGMDGEGRLQFAILRRDRAGWDPVDAPDADLSVSETEMTTTPGPGAFAGFAIGSQTYWIDADGRFVEWVPNSVRVPSGARQVDCASSDRVVSVGALFVEISDANPVGSPDYTGEVWSQRIGGDGSPEPLGSVPPDVAPGPMVCSAGTVSFGDRGTQAVLDLSTGSWTTAPTNLAELSGGFVSPIAGRLAGSPDGTVTFLQASGSQIIQRVGAGLWQPTGAVGHVFPTGSEVLVIADDGAVSSVWPV
jgi:hypothetical protein